MREKIKIKLLQNMLEEVTKKYDYFISLQNEKIKQIFEMATKDKLTGLYNRQYLDEYARQAMGRVKRHENRLILVFIDLDNFKHINDNFGHAQGDKVLQEVAQIFQKTFRDYDIIVRYGGDEFIVLIESQQYNQTVLDETLEFFINRVETKLSEFKISASYGLSVAPDETESLAKLIELADERMYKQKQQKKCHSCD